MFNVQPNLIAGGNINPASFVKISTAADNTALQAAAATDLLIGVAQEGTHDAPGLTGSSAYAATAGKPIQIYGVGDTCLLVLGTGGCTAGQFLTSDASGNGVAAASTNIVGAMSLEAGVAAAKVRVVVTQPFKM
jgi:hypothetical protein